MNPPAYNMDKWYKSATWLAASPADQGPTRVLSCRLRGPPAAWSRLAMGPTGWPMKLSRKVDAEHALYVERRPARFVMGR